METPKIKYHRHTYRTQRAKAFWKQVAADYNAGISATDIAARYINPATGKQYTREHIYWILNKFKSL